MWINDLERRALWNIHSKLPRPIGKYQRVARNGQVRDTPIDQTEGQEDCADRQLREPDIARLGGRNDENTHHKIEEPGTHHETDRNEGQSNIHAPMLDGS